MTLEALIERIDPSKYINEISERKELTWLIIQKYPTLPWKTMALSILAPLKYITQHPDKPWDYTEISGRTDLTIDFIKQHQDKLNFGYISWFIDFQHVLDNPELPWNWKYLSANKKITQDDLIENPELPWNWKYLSSHIDLQFVYANTELPWDYSVLCRRVGLEFILQNPQCERDYFMMSRNPNITIDFILEHPTKSWQWAYITECHNLDDILKYPQCKWDYTIIQRKYPEYCIENCPAFSLNPDIISQYANLDAIKKYTRPINYTNLSKNKNLTIDFIRQNQDKPWDYVELSKIMSLNDILNNWDLPWNIYSICNANKQIPITYFTL